MPRTTTARQARRRWRALATLGLAATAGLTTWSTAAIAEAYTAQRIVREGDGLLCVDLAMCTADAPCNNATDACGVAGEVEGRCVAAIGEAFYCCTESTNCDNYGPGGRCAFRYDGMTGAIDTTFGVCVFDDFDACTDAVGWPAARLAHCLPPAGSAATGDISKGDCDGDGTVNGMDACPCDAAPGDLCLVAPPTDAGTGDGGPSDGGDAGTLEVDGGGGETDAGSLPEAEDAGVGDLLPDSGLSSDLPAGFSFAGEGGCACRLSPGPEGRHGSAAAWLGGLIVGLVVGRRRRRRSAMHRG